MLTLTGEHFCLGARHHLYEPEHRACCYHQGVKKSDRVQNSEADMRVLKQHITIESQIQC